MVLMVLIFCVISSYSYISSDQYRSLSQPHIEQIDGSVRLDDQHTVIRVKELVTVNLIITDDTGKQTTY
jgi:hypothetical protein